MKFRLVVVALACLTLSCGTGSDGSHGISDPDQLSGIAEDLWGSQVSLDSFREGVTTISPFSPATCGYCLLDGEFIEANFRRKTEQWDGQFFHQALFVPQRDVYTYLKHFRCDDVPTLTYPLSLQNFQDSGFPFMIAFKDGRRVYHKVISDYQAAFKDFVHDMQPSDTNSTATLTGPRKLAANYIYEDRSPGYIYVLANSRERYCAELRERLAGEEGVIVKLEHELAESDLKLHLIMEGPTASYDYGFLKDHDTPIKFSNGQVRIGDYRFAFEDIGLVAAFPNPHNRETYVWMRLNSNQSGWLLNNQWNDFTLWRFGGEDQPCEKLIDGVFAKHPGNVWEFSDSLAVTYTNLSGFCKGGVCPLPASSFHKATAHEYQPVVRKWKSLPTGSLMVLGHSNCRLPSIAAGPDGEVAVCWEENGDIVMSVLRSGMEPQVMTVECGSPDSFDPQIAWNGQSYFVVYLSDQDGWYRLYGHFAADGRVSPQVLVSEMTSLDVLTPAVVADSSGRITIAWTQWKANQRLPRYRTFEARTAGPIHALHHVTEGTNDYTNAWHFDLTMDSDGGVVGAWNQHYPATLGVCAGNLIDQASSVTTVSGDHRSNENGGYPSIAVASNGRQWVVRESFWWNTYTEHKPQQILAAYYDDELDAWSTPYVVSDDRQAWLNQSPRIAHHAGGLTAVWSGRADHMDSSWGIYLSSFVQDRWTRPVLVSPAGLCARAPQITVAADNSTWICWHSGIGEEMMTAVLKYQPESLH